MGGGRHSLSRTQANIHLLSAPAHQRSGLTVADPSGHNPRRVLALLRRWRSISMVGGVTRWLPQHGRGPASLPRRGRPPRLTAPAPAHQEREVNHVEGLDHRDRALQARTEE